MDKEKELPPAYPTDGQCSYTDTPPAYSDPVVPPYTGAVVAEPIPVVAVTQEPQQNVWAYELFYCFRDVPTCFVEMCCPCAAEYLTAKRANMKNLGMLLAGVTTALIVVDLIASATFNVMVNRGMRQDLERLNDDYGTDDYFDYDDKIVDSLWSYISLKLLAAAASSLWIARILLGLYLRINLRKRYNIGKPGDCVHDLEDAACVFCCYDCVLCQQMSTVNKIESERKTAARMDRGTADV